MNLRDHMRAIILELTKDNRLYSTHDVITQLREQFPESVKNESKKLENIALKRILNDIENRRSRKSHVEQLDFFDKVPGLGQSINYGAISSAHKSGSRIPILKLTIGEARKYIAYLRSKEPKKNSADAFEHFLDAIDPHSLSDNATLEEAMSRPRY